MPKLETAANIATVLVAGVAIYLVALQPHGARSGSPGEPVAQAELVGRKVESLLIRAENRTEPDTMWLAGAPTLLYVFATTCRFCEAQKEIVADFLDADYDVRVLTASREGPAILAGYWGDRNLTALSLSNESATLLGNQAVPMMYLIGAEGLVQKALLGSMAAWSVERLRREFQLVPGTGELPGRFRFTAPE
jgi:hypothetical protein